MKRLLTACGCSLPVLAFRCGCGNPYFLHVLITTGIFIIAAMSLNLLLGYTGQLSRSAMSPSSASAPTPAR